MLWLAGCMAPPPAVPDVLGPDALLAATERFTAIGPRQVATAGEEQALAEVLAGLAPLDPVAEPFVFDAWRPGTASITVGGETVAVEALSPTPATDIVLPLRDASSDLTGAAAVLSSADGTRAEAFLTAIGGGAAAMIRVTEEVDFDGTPLVEVGHLLDGIAFPALAVDRPTGDWLRERLGQDARLVAAPRITRDHVSENVVARIAPQTDGAKQVYVVAHYDSWHPSEAAFDNALGIGALLLLAERAQQAGVPEREIVFLATSGEEQGLQGANAWAAAHDDEIGPGDVVIVLDVMWSAEGTYRALTTRPELLDDALDATRAVDLPAVAGGDPGIGSDHLPFVLRGADAIWVGRWPDRHYHTVADTLDALDLDEASRALQAQWRLVAQHAGLSP